MPAINLPTDYYFNKFQRNTTDATIKTVAPSLAGLPLFARAGVMGGEFSVWVKDGGEDKPRTTGYTYADLVALNAELARLAAKRNG
jgi:hypothetical protein